MSSTPPDDGLEGLFSQEPRPRHAKRRWPLRILVSLLVVVAVVAAGIGLYAYTVDRSFNDNVNRLQDQFPDETPTGEDQPARPQKKSGDESLNFVLMGSDSRDMSNPQNNGRSDTLMILHLNADRNAAYLISFPRDMYVKIPGHGKNKINAAYSYGGPALSVQTLEQLTGTRMDHIAQVNFEGFVELTDMLGGVTITNEHAFSNRGYTFPKGEITISGEKALVFVRERYKLPRGDLDRAENQRKVVRAIIAKGISPETIRNPRKFNEFVAGFARHIAVDDTLTGQKVRSTATSLRLSPNNIESIQAPITGFADVDGVGSVDVVDERRMQELGEALQDDDVDGYLKKYPEN